METFEKCSVIGCSSPAGARELCRKHYKRWQRYGDTEIVNRPDDWGRIQKAHILRNVWKGMHRRGKGNIDKKWNDFWAFVEDVKSKPEGGVKVSFQRINDSVPWSSSNFYWKASKVSESIRKSKADKMRVRMARLRRTNPDYFRNAGLKKLYGVTLEWYNEQFQKQGGVCAICKQPECYIINGKPIRLAVDHKPGTKIARGLLCANCNRGLGHFRDNPAFLKEASTYLRKYGKIGVTLQPPAIGS